MVCVSALASVFIIATVLLLVGIKEKDRRLFFVGLSNLGLLFLVGGAFTVMAARLDGGHPSKIESLASGVVVGLGLSMLSLGIAGLVRPSIYWPGQPRSNQSPQEKLL